MEITVSHPTISSDKSFVAFELTGTDDVIFKPEDAPNQDACPKPGAQCNLGPKPFVVAGGKLTIDAFPDDCMAHAPVLQTVKKDIQPDSSKFPTYEPLPQTCPNNAGTTNFISYNFNDGNVGNWTGWWGAYANATSGALEITNRRRKDQGPYLDFTVLRPKLCLIPKKTYLLSARIKLDKVDGSMDGEPTQCSVDE